MEEQIRSILKQLGEDPERQGLLKTPQRVAESLKYLTDGYQMDLRTIVNGAIFDDAVDEMVLVRDIEIYSLCEHHLLPFVGRAHVAYIPRRRIIGLSKLPRICDMFSRRLQVQERLTQQIANAVQEVLNPWGVGVILDARHFCMMMRGVQKQNSSTVTSCMLGQFRKDPKTRTEFLRLIGHVQNDGW